DPGPMKLLAPVLRQRLRECFRRPVARGKQLPVLFAVGGFESRHLLLDIELEGIAEQLMHVLLAAPVEWAAWGRACLKWGHDSEESCDSFGVRGPVGQADPPSRANDSRQLMRRRFVIWREHDAAGRRNSVEACVSDGLQPLAISHLLLDLEPLLLCSRARRLDEDRSEVNANHVRASARRKLRY